MHFKSKIKTSNEEALDRKLIFEIVNTKHKPKHFKKISVLNFKSKSESQKKGNLEIVKLLHIKSFGEICGCHLAIQHTGVYTYLRNNLSNYNVNCNAIHFRDCKEQEKKNCARKIIK